MAPEPSSKPSTARVVLLNDDTTTMEFVVEVLREVFGKTDDEAVRLMLDIHRNGSSECGVYTPEQASQIVEEVTELAQQNQYPLRCIVEPGPTT